MTKDWRRRRFVVRPRVLRRMHLIRRPGSQHAAGHHRRRRAVPRARASLPILNLTVGLWAQLAVAWCLAGYAGLGAPSHPIRCTPNFSHLKITANFKIPYKIKYESEKYK